MMFSPYSPGWHFFGGAITMMMVSLVSSPRTGKANVMMRTQAMAWRGVPGNEGAPNHNHHYHQWHMPNHMAPSINGA